MKNVTMVSIKLAFKYFKLFEHYKECWTWDYKHLKNSYNSGIKLNSNHPDLICCKEIMVNLQQTKIIKCFEEKIQ